MARCISVVLLDGMENKEATITLDERKILAVTESMLVWDRIFTDGGLKGDAIYTLLQYGLLHKNSYDFNCPLCGEFRFTKDEDDNEEEEQCLLCPWPGTGISRCCDEGSPFREWDNADSDQEAKAAAGKVFNLLHTMPL